MNKSRFANSYKSLAVETASPARLTLMLYDGSLRFIDQALAGFDTPDLIQMNTRVHTNITRAQAIVIELQSTLNHEVGGEFSITMHRLYDYIYHRLNDGNLNKTKQPIFEAQTCLRELRDAWAEMLNKEEVGTQGASLSRTA